MRPPPATVMVSTSPGDTVRVPVAKPAPPPRLPGQPAAPPPPHAFIVTVVQPGGTVNVDWPALVKACEPGVQVVQTPAAQRPPIPHGLPSGRFMAVSVQVGTPVAQDNAPTLHSLVGVQAAPSLQATHWAVGLQTLPGPQLVPGATVPVWLHTPMPVAQLSVPVRQGLGLQGAPMVQAMHAPLPLQTPPSHAVPPFDEPARWQTGAPVAQLMTPVSQGLGRAQLWPGLQATQLPAPEHTPPSHGTPASTGAAGTQPGAEPVQVVTPRWHDSGRAQGAPGVHGWQAPPTQ